MAAEIQPLQPQEIGGRLKHCMELVGLLGNRLADDTKQLRDFAIDVQQAEGATNRLCYNISELDGRLLKLDAEKEVVLGQLHNARQTELQKALRQQVTMTKHETQRCQELEKMMQELSEGQGQLDATLKDNLALKDENAQLTSELETLKSQLQETTQHLSDTSVGDASLDTEITELRRHNAQLVELNQKLTEQLESQTKTNAQLTKALQDMAEGNELLTKRVTEAEAKQKAVPSMASVEIQTIAEIPVIPPTVPIPEPSQPAPEPLPPLPEPQAKQRPILGLEVSFHGEEGKSLSVVVVKPDGPAHMAGLRVGDLLVNWDGDPIPTEKKNFEMLLKKHKVGDMVTLDISRAGETISMPLKIGGADIKPTPAAPTPRSGASPSPRLSTSQLKPRSGR